MRPMSCAFGSTLGDPVSFQSKVSPEVVVPDWFWAKGARTVHPVKPATQCPAVSTTLGAITDPEHAATVRPFFDIPIRAPSGYALAVDPPTMGDVSLPPRPSSSGP